MPLYESTVDDLTFVILSPEPNYGRLRTTVNGLKAIYPKYPIHNVLGIGCNEQDLEESKKLCRGSHRGGVTITSLVNQVLGLDVQGWCLFLHEGVQPMQGLIRKYFTFAPHRKTVVYPLGVNYDKMGKAVHVFSDFHTASFNGMMIHMDTFREIGEFSENSLQVSKFFWQMEAVDRGCVFHSVLGVKLV